MNKITYLFTFFFCFFIEISLMGQQFTEITSNAGITYSGTSFGQAWQDVDKDGFEDFILTNHGYPYLYKNNGNETFQENPINFFKGFDTINGIVYPIRYDIHGAGFGDINGDGFADLYMPIGGDNGNSSGKKNILFLNNNGNLIYVNKSFEFGLHDSIGRSRSPLWFDQNGDGKIDLFLSNLDRDDNKFKSSLYVQDISGQSFTKNMSLSLRETSLYFSTLIYNSFTKENNMATVSEERDLFNIYDVSATPFSVLLHTAVPNIRDLAIGDFNGDGLQDIFAATSKWGSEAISIDPNNIRVFLKTIRTNENIVRFTCSDTLIFNCHVFPYKEDANTHIFYGKNKLNPSSLVFKLTKDNPETWGTNFTCNLCVPGLYIWYDTANHKWNMVNKDLTNKASSASQISSNSIISNIETVKFQNSSLLAADRIFYQNALGKFASTTSFMKSGSQNKSNCVSVVTADFDNDMDLDLILSCQGQAINYYNKYYVNDGQGKFTNVLNFGAEGSLIGRSGAVTYGDINNDGFLDLLLENGEGQIGENGEALHFNDGPTQLFKNNGNANNWIEINLSSSVGNSFAVGSVVYCYAGGKKQIRQKGTESHCFSQNSQRVHFGLGSNEQIDSLLIIWPNGDSSIYYDIAVNQIVDFNQNTANKSMNKHEINSTKRLQISLYPNPTHNNLVIDGKGNELGLYDLEIYDLNGSKLLESLQVSGNEIAFEQFPVGLYLVRIVDNSGNEYLFKVIKQ